MLFRSQPLWFYAPALIVLLLPWAPVALAAHPRRLWADERVRFFVVWLGFGLALFSLSAGKLPHYLLPLLPAACVLLGISIVEAEHPRRWLAASVALAGALYAGPSEKLLEGIVAGTSGPMFSNLAWVGLGLGALAGWCAGGTFLRTAAVVALLMGGLRHWAAGVADRHTARPYAGMAVKMCAEPDLHRAWFYGLSYYAGAALPDCKSKPRRWHAGNSESGLFVGDTEGSAK